MFKFPHFSSLESAKANYSRPSLPSLHNARHSPSTPSSNSKDTQPNSEKSLSNEDSLSDTPKFSCPPSLASLRNYTSNTNRSVATIHRDRVLQTRSTNQAVDSLNDLSALDDLSKKIKPPTISARCWAIMDGKTGQLIYSRKETRKREIASLTKMMNLLCVLKLLEEYHIDPKNTYLEVSKLASSMKGTSANLRSGDVLSVWDLLHGLMLPSGNDAAWALAESFGKFIYLRSEEYQVKCRDSKASTCKNPLKYFLRFMNKTAQDLGMIHTNYANPHGLVNPFNVSTAGDQATLSHHLLKWEMAREIVNTQVYSCEIEMPGNKVRKATWENTNKLLGKEGWGGVKTGITTAAGYCLSSYYEKGNESYIVILLCSSSKEIRWVEAPQLVQFARKIREEQLL